MLRLVLLPLFICELHSALRFVSDSSFGLGFNLKLINYRTMQWTTHRCPPMLFVYFPALLPLTQVRSRNINKGDRKDADTAEGGLNRINRVRGKDSYLIDAITDDAIGNRRVKKQGDSHAASGTIFAEITSFGRPFRYT